MFHGLQRGVVPILQFALEVILTLCSSVEKFEKKMTSCYVYQPINCFNFDKDIGFQIIYLR